jgi:hypothetical protein
MSFLPLSNLCSSPAKLSTPKGRNTTTDPSMFLNRTLYCTLYFFCFRTQLRNLYCRWGERTCWQYYTCDIHIIVSENSACSSIKIRTFLDHNLDLSPSQACDPQSWLPVSCYLVSPPLFQRGGGPKKIEICIDVKLNCGEKKKGTYVEDNACLAELEASLPSQITCRALWRVAQSQYDPWVYRVST